MAKQSGLGDQLYVAGYDLSGDIGSLSRIGGGPAALDVTGIDKSAPERLGGERDGEISFSAWFNKATDRAHPVLKTLPSTDRIVTYCRGATLGNPAASMVAKQVNYDPTRGQDGSLSMVVQALANGYGLEWGTQLTAGKRTDSSGTNGAGVDLGSASPGAFGLQAYLHVFAFTGTSVTIKIQESSDNGGTDPFADVVGGAFSVVTGVTSERIATAAINVERYLRVVTTGTFSNAVFAVTATRNEVAVSF
jgi:hypothetical protein